MTQTFLQKSIYITWLEFSTNPAVSGSQPTYSYHANMAMPAMQQIETMNAKPGMFRNTTLHK